MPDDTTNNVAKTYEGTSITAKAHIPDADREFVEEVTFKFLQDGEQFEEKTVAVPQDGGSSDSSGGSADASSDTGSDSDTGSASPIVSHSLEAPLVPDDKDSYFLEYHFFYKVKKTDGSTEAHQSLSAQRIEVFPRTAQLKVTRAKDDTPFPGFEFKIYQNGEELSTERTLASDTTNAQDESIPAGSVEFNLGLYSGFRIVQVAPFEVTEEVVETGCKREVKGTLKFRAVFVAPEKGSIKQYVNYDVVSLGQTGFGHEVTIEVGVHPEDRAYVKDEEEVAVHFRVTYGPESGEPVAKSARDDADHPTKVVPVSESDTSVTVEEKEAGVLYEGNVVLAGGAGKFKVCLGKAGGDTCLVEISGSDKFLTEETVLADAALDLKNWRRVYYELMVPHLMQHRIINLEREAEEERPIWVLESPVLQKLAEMGRQLFIEFEYVAIHLFNAVKHADYGTLVPRRFLELPGAQDEPIYVLSGRNWRDVPAEQAWQEAHPGKTLYIHLCDGLLKWRRDTEDEQAGTTDFSGTLTEVAGDINMEDKFEGLFMPFSGYNAEDGIADVHWTADISKDDDVCTYTPELEVNEFRAPGLASVNLPVYISAVQTGGLPMPVFFAKNEEGAFEAELSEAQTAQIQKFITTRLEDQKSLIKADGILRIYLECVEGSDQGEDDCFNAVKDKLQELFDADKEDITYHPGLDEAGEARTGTLRLPDITDGNKSTVTQWHFQLPVEDEAGNPGPGAFVGEEKTKNTCPINIEFSVQPHELSIGEAEGKRVAWVCDPVNGRAFLVRVLLKAFSGIEDEACVAHGHGDEGLPGDCLEEADGLCADCINHARSKNLTIIL